MTKVFTLFSSLDACYIPAQPDLFDLVTEVIFDKSGSHEALRHFFSAPVSFSYLDLKVN